MSRVPERSTWLPPSDALKEIGGIWYPATRTDVSYPDEGNALCFQIEDDSYWFAHRNRAIQQLLQKFPPAGTVFDVGGGNGFVALALQEAGYEVALVEPGSGANNARSRGLRRVVGTTLEDAKFQPGSFPAAAAFDVVEHIEDERRFLETMRELLAPKGRFYCSVPAFEMLWSGEDIYAGHFRRYSRATMRAALEKAGFQVEFMSYLFSWLVTPVFFQRALPFRLLGNRRKKPHNLASARASHVLPPGLRNTINKIHEWELRRLDTGRSIPLGSTLLCVATRR
jgi:SAM-dependent methyltransferase